MRLIGIFLMGILAQSLFAASRVEIITGTILATEEDFCGKAVDYVLNAALASEQYGHVIIVLAPKWYLVQQKLEIRKGDKVEITASRHDGKWHVITIKKDGRLYKLRDHRSKPLWKPEPGSEDLFKNICKA